MIETRQVFTWIVLTFLAVLLILIFYGYNDHNPIAPHMDSSIVPSPKFISPLYYFSTFQLPPQLVSIHQTTL